MGGGRALNVETEERIALSRFGSLGESVIRVSPQSLQLQIGLPVWPVKSTHDVSLSQLWVEIHRINSFVRETHAWEFLYTVRLVRELARPILPQAMGKQGNTPKHAFTDMHSTSFVYTHIYIYICVSICLHICLSLSSCLTVSVCVALH